MGRRSRAHEPNVTPKVDPTNPQPTGADWADVINTIKIHGDFDRAAFRAEMKELARELEAEGHRAHRNADWLEGLSYREEWDSVDRELTRQGYCPRPGEDRTPEERRLLDRVMSQHMPSAARARSTRWSAREHSRSAIMSRLERPDDKRRKWHYDERHFRLIKPQLDRLVDGNLYKRDRTLRKVAALLLDASEIIDDELKTSADFIKAHRKHQDTKDGRNPLRAIRTLLAFMDEWDLDPVVAAERFAKDSICYEPESLKTDIWRYRTGKMGPK